MMMIMNLDFTAFEINIGARIIHIGVMTQASCRAGLDINVTYFAADRIIREQQ